MECKKCGDSFNGSVVIDGVRKNLNRRKYCLSCSPYKEHNNRKLELISDSKKCPKCTEVKILVYFYTRENGLPYSYCISCWNKLSTQRQAITKQWCLDYKGGKCERCEYNKCSEALDFHHRERKHKKFNISQMKSFGLEKLKTELDKCDLLCCRCHREVESEKRKGR